MMRVQVRLHGCSWEGFPSGTAERWVVGRQEVALPEGATLADLIRLLQVDEPLVCLVTVNGRAAGMGNTLADGDSVDLIPPITGGGRAPAGQDRASFPLASSVVALGRRF